MKKLGIIIPIITALLGLLIGFFIFSNNGEDKNEYNHSEMEIQESEIWTCSMHPQIRQNEPGACPICGMDLIPLASNSNSSGNPHVLEMTKEAVQLAQIQTVVVGEGKSTSSSSIKLNGKIQANESEAASLVAHLPGRIEKLYISFTGEKIKKGDRIATIYSPELVAAQRELLEAKKLASTSPELLEAAKNKLKYWKVDNAFISQVLSSETIVETFTIYSEKSGVVMEKKVTVGDYIKVGDVLFNLQNLDKLWVLMDVYENDLAKITLGSEIFFSTPSITNKNFTAKISFIDPVINASTRVAHVRAEVNNSNQALKPEMFVTGTIKGKITKSNNSNITIPKTAVLYTGERSVVYVELPNTEIPSYEFREVALEESKGENYVISSGLKNGEKVVIYGAFVIDAAAQLNNQASMMNRLVKVDGNNSNNLPDYTTQSPKEFKEQLEELTATYMDLKDAFVATDQIQAKTKAALFNKKIKEVDMLLLKGDAHNYWMQQEEALLTHSQEIITTEDIEKQRDQFYFLSQTLIKSLKVFGVSEGDYYIQHCPMANKNNGADWISKDLKIKNPYFGSAMMTCGLTQDTINKNYKNILETPIEFQPIQNHNH